MALWILAFVMLVVLIVLAIAAVIVVAMVPGKIAQKRNHPQQEAINVLAWAGLLLSFGVLWIIALAWAYTRPLQRLQPQSASTTEPLSPNA